MFGDVYHIFPTFSFFLQESQMFQKNLSSDEYQYDSAGQLCFCFIPGPENISDFHTNRREGKCHNAYEGNCPDNVHLKECKGNAYRQSVNAGSHCQKKHCFYIQRCICITALCTFPGQGFPNHIPPIKARSTNAIQ